MDTKIIVEIEVRNKRDWPVSKIIPRGRIIEVADPTSIAQHAMVVRDYVVTIPPNKTVTVYVEAMCFIKRKSWPQGATGNITPYSFQGASIDQNDLWNQLGY